MILQAHDWLSLTNRYTATAAAAPNRMPDSENQTKLVVLAAVKVSVSAVGQGGRRGSSQPTSASNRRRSLGQARAATEAALDVGSR